MTENELHQLFQQMRDEPVPAESLARVRLAVADRTAKRQSGARWFWLAVIGATVIVLAVGTIRLTTRQSFSHLAVRETPAAPAPAIAPLPRPRVAVAASPAIRPQKRSVPHRKSPQKPVGTIRIETADPDVVIFLVDGGS